MTNTTAAERMSLGTLARKQIVGLVFLLVVTFGIASMLISTFNWMLDDQRLPLSELVVEGQLHYVHIEDVQTALSSIEHIGTFMSQDVDELQQALNELPWVAYASIRKQWPETVKVYLVEHQALAIWNGMDLLNQQGDIFFADIASLDAEKVKLYGPEGSNHQVVEAWAKIDGLLEPLGLHVSSLVLNDRRAWQVILSSGIRLELGKEALEERVRRFTLLYKKLGNKAEKISHIDLRYDTGAAVGWFPEQDLIQERVND
ncbi:cell division protein FtsQ/DivIB [Vibrio tapetis subsp. quintayensis]|uniref:cell division protein FtsQ/DivIB n=1 Tax=Vibrio tapetis TaxID=52443 RepID=UPI0025B55422|nr:cell division protein FtsQ/DivIB [Vibrio tapetis]MDN3681545.1 cell division protein FtsQ/DivIB [Vibrio tapetis subsp. quintayensis]